MAYKQVKIIFFTSKTDFKDRIATLLNTRKDDEVYEFIFSSKEVEEEFNIYMSRFKRTKNVGAC